MPGSGKAPQGTSKENFRARRLSVSDIDTSEFDKAQGQGQSATPQPGRQRRMSMSPEMGVVKPKAQLPFPLEFVGTYSCHGVEPGMRAGETAAKINQDRGCVSYPFGDTNQPYQQALFCVYDGHGALGDKVSHFVMNQIQEQLELHQALDSDPATALKETFVNVDNQLKADRSIDAELSGTTAVVILLRKPKGSNIATSWTAWCGDSRATLCSIGPNMAVSHKDLSEDQKPDTPAEMARIKKAGGFVSPPEEEWGGPARVWLDAAMTLPGLAMARSIGDHLVSSVGVTAEPEVRKEEIEIPEEGSHTGNQFFIMASDGVWEFIESIDACKLVNKFLDPSQPKDATVSVTKLIETAAAKWRQEEGDYRDDITAIVVRLPGLFDQALPGQ